MHQTTIVRPHEGEAKYKCALQYSDPFYKVRKS